MKSVIKGYCDDKTCSSTTIIHHHKTGVYQCAKCRLKNASPLKPVSVLQSTGLTGIPL